ncbi:ATP-binding protein [Streptomyces sp. NPDC046881]|uniref:ATP-binding protein n=1 Tax=Streptomyces sp. NPDC046881 TaxID=3155374 RepID=UPI0033D3414A
MTRTIPRESLPGGVIPGPAAPGSSGTGSWSLPWSPTACGLARNAVRDVLTRWGLDELVPVAELLVSELVCNALRHGAGPLRLTLERAPQVRCAVGDGSSRPPRPTEAGPDDEGGRGLALVDTLAARWGHERSLPSGKTVWFELTAGAEEPDAGAVTCLVTGESAREAEGRGEAA